jgi:hypothetical protein
MLTAFATIGKDAEQATMLNNAIYSVSRLPALLIEGMQGEQHLSRAVGQMRRSVMIPIDFKTHDHTFGRNPNLRVPFNFRY